MHDAIQSALRTLPSVSETLDAPWGIPLAARFGAGVFKFTVRGCLEEIRQAIQSAADGDDQARAAALRLPETLPQQVASRLERLALPDGRRAVNATGILLHTGLGRARLSEAACAAMARAGHDAVLLQTDPETGTRCPRDGRVESILRALTGCEAATVVNNNAAATMLVLHALANGREVPLSRGQMIEIGGAFRMPEIMAASGVTLREIGCTNRTHLADYERAVSEATGALLHVHTSNYRVRGFGGTPDVAALAALAHRHGLPMIDDVGSGALLPLSRWGLDGEPLLRDSLAAGSDVVCCSGDKLIGGPQAGILLGRKGFIDRIRKDPFARMFRPCKLTLAALEATLLHYLNDEVETHIPFYRMLATPLDTLQARGDALLRNLQIPPGATLSVVPSGAEIGSGSIPDHAVPSRALRLALPGTARLDAIARALRERRPSIVPRVHDGAVWFDLRTVEPEEDSILLAALASVLGGEA